MPVKLYMHIHSYAHVIGSHTHLHTLSLTHTHIYITMYTVTEQATTPAQEEAILEERSARLDYHMDTKHMDANKAKQAERLGMGGLRARYVRQGSEYWGAC